MQTLSRRASTLADTTALAQCLAPHLQAGDWVFLEGPLGAGKTYFAGALAHALGVPESTPMPSPTFGLVHEVHDGRVPIRHADLYRLEHARDVHELGLQENETEVLYLMEWSHRFFPSRDGLLIRIDVNGTERTFHVESLGKRGNEIIQGMGSF